MNLTYTLLADGSSDSILMPIIDWTLEQIPNIRITSQFASILPKPSMGLSHRAENTIRVYECDILFVHRDAEKIAVDRRISEINDSLSSLGQSYVPIVPIRMTEAWLLIDEQAIRTAANNPNGTNKLTMPNVTNLENIVDPKAFLFEKLKLASDLPPGRLKKFKPGKCRHRVAELISDYSRLRKLSAFVKFEQDLIAGVEAFRQNN